MRRAARRLQADYEDGTLELRTSAEPKTIQELLSDWLTSPKRQDTSTFNKAEWAVKRHRVRLDQSPRRP